MLHLQLLGGFDVRVDDAPITHFRSDKARALLVYLAVEADRPHQRASLAALLWPDGPLTASSLRTAYRAGELEVTMIARKMLTTKRAIAAMTEGARRRRPSDGR